MKRFIAIFVAIFVLIPFLTVGAKPKVPTVSDETKKEVEETTDKAVENSQMMEQTYEKRQALILKGIEESLKLLTEVEKNIDQSENLSAEQKTELKPITNNIEKMLTDYQAEVKSAKDSDDLYAATKNFAKTVAGNKEQIRSSVATVIMIGIEQVLKAADDFFKTAETISKALKVCNVDTTEVDSSISTGEKDLATLTTMYDKISSDQKISEDEQTELKEAAKLAAKLSTEMAKITAQLTDLSTQCPAVQ